MVTSGVTWTINTYRANNTGGNDNIINNGGLTVTGAGNLDIRKYITGSGSLTLNSTGTLTLGPAPNSGQTTWDCTYAGNTTITSGTLRIRGDYATANQTAPIPYGSGKGNVVFDAATNTAILNLNGRSININGLSQTTASTTNKVVNNGTGTSTLTVGNNNATSTFAGIVADNTGTGGTLALTKTGTGTLTLSGTNTYTGTTTVTGGTLAGSGCATSNTVVQTGATLAPGAGIGTFLCKGGTLASGATLAIEIDSTGDTADKLDSTVGNIDITGATVSFTEIGTGTIPAGTKLAIIDYTGKTLTGAFTGYAEGTSITVGANTFTLSYVDSSKVTLTSTTGASAYSIWASAHGITGQAFDGDFDKDGISNGLEWIFGGNPNGHDAAAPVTVTGDVTTGLTLVFTRNPDSIATTTLTVDWDTDLDVFAHSLSIGTVDVGPSGNNPTIDIDAPTAGKVTVHIPAANSVNGRLFARVHATQP
ncbi:MAG: autotransporter-associated beta strand repeat-containing protein [Luteolibacter sp.]